MWRSFKQLKDVLLRVDFVADGQNQIVRVEIWYSPSQRPARTHACGLDDDRLFEGRHDDADGPMFHNHFKM